MFYFEFCLAATLCTQLMDEIGCGVETFEQMVSILGKRTDCLRNEGLILTPYKCETGMTSINILGNTVTFKRLTAETAKIEKL